MLFLPFVSVDAAEPVFLYYLTEEEVGDAIAQLEEEDDSYSEILIYDQQQLEKPNSTVVNIAMLPPNKSFNAVWGVSPNITRVLRSKKVDTQGTNLTWGLNNGYEEEVLKLYLDANGGMKMRPVPMDGNCFYHAIRRSIKCPANYSNQFLRRQLTYWMCLHAEEVFPLIKDMLLYAYGHVSEEHEGPYSFIQYLRAQMREGEEGDDISLFCISLMWQLRLTVVVAGDFPYQILIRHKDPLPKVDLCMVFTGGKHYIASCLVSEGNFTDVDGQEVTVMADTVVPVLENRISSYYDPLRDYVDPSPVAFLLYSPKYVHDLPIPGEGYTRVDSKGKVSVRVPKKAQKSSSEDSLLEAVSRGADFDPSSTRDTTSVGTSEKDVEAPRMSSRSRSQNIVPVGSKKRKVTASAVGSEKQAELLKRRRGSPTSTPEEIIEVDSEEEGVMLHPVPSGSSLPPPIKPKSKKGTKDDPRLPSMESGSATTALTSAASSSGTNFVTAAQLEESLKTFRDSSAAQLEASLLRFRDSFNLPGSSTSSPRVSASGSSPVVWPMPQEGAKRCTVCMVECRSYRALQLHMEIHTGEGTRTCAKCKKSFSNMPAFRDHHQVCVLGKKIHQCPACLKYFSSQRNLTVHSTAYHGPPESAEECRCPHCAIVYKRKRLMQSHKTSCSLRPDAVRYTCIECGKSYARNRDMLSHLRKEHPEYKPQ